jgi:hypothetical protein
MKMHMRSKSSELAERVHDIQVPMLQEAESVLRPEGVQGLRCLIRLAVEFESLLIADPMALDEESLAYECDSIFAGVDSFVATRNEVEVECGRQTPHAAQQFLASFSDVKSDFQAKYLRFLAETDFGTRCRLVLDLFRVQLVFAATMYPFR